MIIGSKLHLDEDIQSIAVTYSQFLGYIKTSLLLLSALVMTLAVVTTPI